MKLAITIKSESDLHKELLDYKGPYTNVSVFTPDFLQMFSNLVVQSITAADDNGFITVTFHEAKRS